MSENQDLSESAMNPPPFPPSNGQSDFTRDTQDYSDYADPNGETPPVSNKDALKRRAIHQASRDASAKKPRTVDAGTNYTLVERPKTLLTNVEIYGPVPGEAAAKLIENARKQPGFQDGKRLPYPDPNDSAVILESFSCVTLSSFPGISPPSIFKEFVDFLDPWAVLGIIN